MSNYAKDTTVSPQQSLSEIQTTLKRYGSTSFGFIEADGKLQVAFTSKDGWRIRFTLYLPNLNEFARTPERKLRRSTEQTQKEYQQAIRQKYRALALTIKAKLESVASGIETFEQAFMANVILPSGQTVDEWMSPQVKEAYLTGKMPPLLLQSGE